MTADLAPVIDTPTARILTDRIKTGVEAIWELIIQAYTHRAWDALGYSSWDDYCTREFGTSRLRLPREERAEVVSSLRESGLSIRAIESATGISRDTIYRDQREVLRNRTPDEPVDEDAIAEELIANEYSHSEELARAIAMHPATIHARRRELAPVVDLHTRRPIT